MAAINAVYMSFLGQGAHVVGTDSVYGPSRMVLENENSRFGVVSSWVDSSRSALVEAAMRPETKMVYIESPANPTMKLSDLRACAEIAHAAGALFVVDNTFASPALQRPLEMGADIVVHSLTKFLNGHTDVVGGVIVAKRREHLDRLKKVHYQTGGTMDPHQAWLILRGIKTLGLRMEKAQANALEVGPVPRSASFGRLGPSPGPRESPAVRAGQEADGRPGRGLLVRREGRSRGGKALINSLKLATLAVSPRRRGDARRAPGFDDQHQHAADRAEAAGITDDLVRLAVGCEDVRDLIADLTRALAVATAVAGVPVNVSAMPG